MEEKRRILACYISGLASILLVMLFMYVFNDIRYECITKDELQIIAKEIKVEGDLCFGKMEDGTYVEIKSYREISRLNFITYMIISAILYVVINFLLYKVIITY